MLRRCPDRVTDPCSDTVSYPTGCQPRDGAGQQRHFSCTRLRLRLIMAHPGILPSAVPLVLLSIAKPVRLCIQKHLERLLNRAPHQLPKSIPDRLLIYLNDFFTFLCTISPHDSCLLSRCWTYVWPLSSYLERVLPYHFKKEKMSYVIGSGGI